MGNLVWVDITYTNNSPDSRCAGTFLIDFIYLLGFSNYRRDWMAKLIIKT